MTRLVTLLCAVLMAGCSVGLRLDVQGTGEARARREGPTLGRLVLAHRETVERWCSDGSLTVVECAHQRTHLRTLLEARTDEDRRLSAGALALAAGGVADGRARARLFDTIDPILERLR